MSDGAALAIDSIELSTRSSINVVEEDSNDERGSTANWKRICEYDTLRGLVACASPE